MNETNEVIDVNIEQPLTATAQTAPPRQGRAIALMSPTAVKPGDIGQLPFRAERPSRIHDLVLDKDAEISRVLVGRESFFRKPQETREQLFARVPAVGAGTYTIVLVQNLGDEARILEGEIYVSDAVGGDVVDAAPKTGGTPTSETQTQASGGGGGNVGIAGKTVVSRRQAPIQSRVIPPQRVKRYSPEEFAGSTQEGVVRGAPVAAALARPASNDSEFAEASITASIVGSTARNDGSEHRGELPQDGHHAVYMAPGHAHGLMRLLKFRTPMLKPFRHTLMRQLSGSLERTGVATTSDSTTEIVAIMPRLLIIHLVGFLRRTMGPLAPNEIRVALLAIEKGLATQRGTATTEQTTPDSEAIVVSALG